MSDPIDFQPMSGGAIDFQPLDSGKENGLFGQELDKGTTAPADAFEQDKSGPGLIDTSVDDLTMAQGLGGVAKLGAGAVGKGVGSVLDAIPLTENLSPTVRRVANNQMLKSMGGTMSQIGQMAKGRGGREALDRAAEYGLDNGLGDVFSTSIGREKTLEGLLEESGKKAGNLRDEAGLAPPGILNDVVKDPRIDKYLGSGSASKELGGVDTALNDIREISGENPTHSGIADAATYINKNAAGNKMYQPVNAETDVANIASDLNNRGIVQSLGADKGKQYLKALEDQTVLHPLKHLSDKGELREAGSRGPGLGAHVVQEIADRFGYRMSTKMASAIHDALSGKMAKGAASELSALPNMKNFSGAKAVPPAISEWMKKRGED